MVKNIDVYTQDSLQSIGQSNEIRNVYKTLKGKKSPPTVIKIKMAQSKATCQILLKMILQQVFVIVVG